MALTLADRIVQMAFTGKQPPELDGLITEVTGSDVTISEITSIGGNITVSGTLQEVLQAIIDAIDPEEVG